MIRVLIADDQRLFRLMLEELLSKSGSIEVIALADDGQSAVELTRQHKPDIVLLDVKMPNKTGMEALQVIKTEWPKTKVIMLTTFEDMNNSRLAYTLGADGYLVKDVNTQTLIKAIECVNEDIVVFHRNIWCNVQKAIHQPIARSTRRWQQGNLSFDAIDLAIIEGIVEGKTNKEIAQMLNYSEGTVKNRISKLLSVTGLTHRTDISVFALKNEIL